MSDNNQKENDTSTTKYEEYIVSDSGIMQHISGDMYKVIMPREVFVEAFRKYISNIE